MGIWLKMCTKKTESEMRCLCCRHEETGGPQLPIERFAKTDQTARMRRLIRVFAGRICIFADFVVLRHEVPANFALSDIL